jgi:chemotaxis signal transduction protein
MTRARTDAVAEEDRTSWLVFSLGPNQLAVELGRVIAIQEGRDIFPVPLVSPRVLGVTYWRDQALPVLKPEVLSQALGQDFEGTPGRRPAASSAEPQLLGVMEWEGDYLGILFDRIERVVRGAEIEETGEDELPTPRSDLVKPWGRYRRRALYRLNLERILEQVREGGLRRAQPSG